MLTIPFDEIATGASARLCVIDGVQYLSARDVIMHVNGKNNKQASQVWDRLPEDKLEEVSSERRNFKFPGQGQSEQPVLTFQGVLKLIMWIGGENAKKYRSVMVTILSRYYAGDGSLVDEIEANAQSNAPIAQMARASLAAEAGPAAVHDEVALTHKRKIEELEITRMEIEIDHKRRAADHELITTKRAADHEHLTKCTRSYQEICQDTTMDERARLIFKDLFLNMAMQQQPGVTGLLTDGSTASTGARPISLSLVAGEMGLRIPSNDLISIGVELKKRYVALHGKDPSKHDQLCNGRVTKVNSYMESDRPLVEEILRWYTAGRP